MNPENNKGSNKYKKWHRQITNFLVLSFIVFIFFNVKVGEDIYTPNPKVLKAHKDILRIQSFLKLFQKDNKSYPTTKEGLDALLINPNSDKYPNHQQYIQSLPPDPWGSQYQYLSPGSHGDFDIYSFGPDGKLSDDDIGNWEDVERWEMELRRNEENGL